MAEKKETAVKAKKKKQQEIFFRCQRCETLRPLEDMRSVTRFIPVLIVCKKCEKELR
jgi:predicted SprT family Zn-dependent metalloprotease